MYAAHKRAAVCKCVQSVWNILPAVIPWLMKTRPRAARSNFHQRFVLLVLRFAKPIQNFPILLIDLRFLINFTILKLASREQAANFYRNLYFYKIHIFLYQSQFVALIKHNVVL